LIVTGVLSARDIHPQSRAVHDWSRSAWIKQFKFTGGGGVIVDAAVVNKIDA
jgi:hypothetical protein